MLDLQTSATQHNNAKEFACMRLQIDLVINWVQEATRKSSKFRTVHDFEKSFLAWYIQYKISNPNSVREQIPFCSNMQIIFSICHVSSLKPMHSILPLLRSDPLQSYCQDLRHGLLPFAIAADTSVDGWPHFPESGHQHSWAALHSVGHVELSTWFKYCTRHLHPLCKQLFQLCRSWLLWNIKRLNWAMWNRQKGV